MTLEITQKILYLEQMIIGVDIGIERARELRERMVLEGHQETLGLDALIGILRKDKAELKASMKELQRRL